METIERNVRELNDFASRTEQRIQTLAMDEIPGLFVLAERSLALTVEELISAALERNEGVGERDERLLDEATGRAMAADRVLEILLRAAARADAEQLVSDAQEAERVRSDASHQATVAELKAEIANLRRELSSLKSRPDDESGSRPHTDPSRGQRAPIPLVIVEG
jgi:hypothetical protein